MHLVKKLLLSALLLTLLSFILVLPIYAAQDTKQQTVILGAGQVVNHDYITAGKNVIIDGTVNGDTYVAGGVVDVNGTINGDLLVAGGQVTIRGTVTHNIRAIGGSILVDGNTGGNVSIVGGNVEFSQASKVTGSIVMAGGSISSYGIIGKDLRFAGGSMRLASLNGGSVDAAVGSLVLLPQAVIREDLVYTSKQTAQILPGAKVLGKVTHTLPPATNKQSPNPAFAIIGFLAVIKLISFISALIIGYILVRLMPTYTDRIVTTVQTEFWKSLGIGFVALVATPVAAIILLVTVIGIPIAALAILALFVLGYFAKIFVGISLGLWIGRLFKKTWRIWSALVIGLFVYFVLSLITPINFFLNLIVLFVGIGAAVIEEIRLFSQLRSKKII